MQKAKKRLFSVTAVLLAVLVALTALLPTAGAAQAATMKSKYTGKSYTHNARFNKLEVLNGVDISAWQEKVNWKKIKNDGIDFAILRAGYGKNASQEDAYFATNFKNATAAGLPVGIYWYSYAKSVADVEKEARLCLQVLGSRTLDLPVFYDLEESSQLNKGKAFCTQLVEHFCSIIAAAGHTPGLYMSRSPLLDYIEQESRGRYALWVAEYGSKTCKYDGDYLMWQYADNGKVAGVNGNTDMDFLYGNKNSLPGSATLLKSKTYTGKAITPAPTVTGEDGQPLEADKDYTLTYTNNKAVGMATITAQGLGTYTGRRWYYRFKILPAKVTGLTLESRSKTRLTYIWNATPGANAYLVKVINRTTGKGFDKAVSTTRVDLTDLTDTQLYEVQVAAYRGNTAYRGPYSKVNAKHTLPGTVTGLKTKKTATGSITLEWNKKPGADGYVVYQYCRQEADKALGHHHRPQLCVQGQRRQAGHQILLLCGALHGRLQDQGRRQGHPTGDHHPPHCHQMHRRQIRQKAADFRALEQSEMQRLRRAVFHQEELFRRQKDPVCKQRQGHREY